jgi:hypothetical protein
VAYQLEGAHAGIDQLGAARVRAIEHLRRRRASPTARPRSGRCGQSFSHDQQVLRGRAVSRQISNAEVLGDPGNQRRDARPLGGISQPVAAVVHTDRLDPLWLEAGGVGRAQPSPAPALALDRRSLAAIRTCRVGAIARAPAAPGMRINSPTQAHDRAAGRLQRNPAQTSSFTANKLPLC